MSSLGLKKNLIFVAILEEHGYDLIFSKGKAFVRHIATGQVKHIRVHVKNLYKPHVEDCVALSTKVEKVHIHDVVELWHRRLDYLHHGTLNIMQQITTSLPKVSHEKHDVCKGCTGCTLGKYTKSTFHD